MEVVYVSSKVNPRPKIREIQKTNETKQPYLSNGSSMNAMQWEDNKEILLKLTAKLLFFRLLFELF